MKKSISDELNEAKAELKKELEKNRHYINNITFLEEVNANFQAKLKEANKKIKSLKTRKK